MIRNDKKRAILMTAILLLSACAFFEPVVGSSGASYTIYVKTSGGWALQEELHPSKYYETSSVDLSAVLPDVDGEYKVRIAQQGGIAAHIDYVVFSNGTPIAPTSAICVDDERNILRKVVSLDNDVADAWGKTIECEWAGGSSSSVLLFTANQELYTIEAPLHTPYVMTPELMLPYTIQNNGMFIADGVPNPSDADFSDYWTPTSGHPYGYTYLWLRSDGEFLYAIMEVTADNTYDETGWARLYVYANGALKDFRVDAMSDEYGIDRFVYTDTVPWQHMVYEFSIPLPEIGAAIGDTIKIGFGSYGTGYAAEVEKWVLDPEGIWVKARTANIGDTLRFKCTITNPQSNFTVSEIRFWDILDCSLNYSGNATLTNASGVEEEITAPCPLSYCFKPQVLHPYNLSWDPYSPALGYDVGENFTELCPDTGHHHKLITWNDTNYDERISACDQVYLLSAPGPYHVENVPYTLLVNNPETGESMYIESLLDYESATLSAPNGTEWLTVCGCKDRYTLIDWQDIANINGHLSVGDLVTLRNEQTGEEVQYTVEEVTIDLVVSKEWQIDWLPNGNYTPRILEPTQSITIEYDATVVRCGVDKNTFRATYYACTEGYCFRSYSNEDKVTIEVPCPTARAPVITPIGIAALISLLSVIAIGTIARLRKKS
jgi:uncharacterized repeat protein (TIGR01451 family)